MVLQTVRNFGKVQDAVKILDLVRMQRSSYEHFLQKDVVPTQRACIGLEALFREIFPIESYDKSMYLEYLYYELEKPRYTPNECRQLRLTYGCPLKICCRLRAKDEEDLAEQSIYLGEMPVMIGGGEFIINGAVRVIVSQLHRSPGVDFLIESKEGDRVLHGGRIVPKRGSWIEIGVTLTPQRSQIIPLNFVPLYLPQAHSQSRSGPKMRSQNNPSFSGRYVR